MTLVVTMNHPQGIVMSADSRRTNETTPVDWEFNPIGPTVRSFDTTQKLYPVGGAGCFSYWGDVQRLERELPGYRNRVAQPLTDVISLKEWIVRFLREEVAPHQCETHGETGFHIAGYDKGGRPRIFHVFWGWQADVTDHEKIPPDYYVNDHSNDFIVCNGIPAHAISVVMFLADLRYQVGLNTWIGDYGAVFGLRLNDYLIRYTARLDETVGDHIVNSIILPGNKNLIAINTTLYPLEVVSLSFHLQQLMESDNVNDIHVYNQLRLTDPLMSTDGVIAPVAVTG